MNKFLLIVISALLTACGALLGMQLLKTGTITDDLNHIRATTSAICQAMADMGHPIVQVKGQWTAIPKAQIPVQAAAPMPEKEPSRARGTGAAGMLPAKAKAAK